MHPKALPARGFTLIELVVVIAILGLLALASYPSILNVLEASALDGTGRDLLMALQTAKWKATADGINYRVRFSQDGASWAYVIEKESAAGAWTTAPGSPKKSVPLKFGPTVTLPTSNDIIFTPTGFVSNCDSTRNSITVSSAKLAKLNQKSNRTVRFYMGGSIQFIKD